MGTEVSKHFTSQELQEKAMLLWERYGERYQSLIPKYTKLLARKRELKIKPLNAVLRSTIADIPEIKFLGIRSKKAARACIKKMKLAELSKEIFNTEMMVDGYAFNTIEAHIYDFEYEIRHHGEVKSICGSMDPMYKNTCKLVIRRTYAGTN